MRAVAEGGQDMKKAAWGLLIAVLLRANLDGLGGDDVYWQSERLKRDEGQP